MQKCKRPVGYYLHYGHEDGIRNWLEYVCILYSWDCCYFHQDQPEASFCLVCGTFFPYSLSTGLNVCMHKLQSSLYRDLFRSGYNNIMSTSMSIVRANHPSSASKTAKCLWDRMRSSLPPSWRMDWSTTAQTPYAP